MNASFEPIMRYLGLTFSSEDEPNGVAFRLAE